MSFKAKAVSFLACPVSHHSNAKALNCYFYANLKLSIDRSIASLYSLIQTVSLRYTRIYKIIADES